MGDGSAEQSHLHTVLTRPCFSAISSTGLFRHLQDGLAACYVGSRYLTWATENGAQGLMYEQLRCFCYVWAAVGLLGQGTCLVLSQNSMVSNQYD